MGKFWTLRCKQKENMHAQQNEEEYYDTKEYFKLLLLFGSWKIEKKSDKFWRFKVKAIHSTQLNTTI